MVALMKFTRDICRLLGLGSGPPVQQQEEQMDCGAANPDPGEDATLSQDALNGEEDLSEEEKARRRAERRKAKRKRRRKRKKQEQVKQNENRDDEEEDGGAESELDDSESDAEAAAEDEKQQVLKVEEHDATSAASHKDVAAPVMSPSGIKGHQKTRSTEEVLALEFNTVFNSMQEPEWDVSSAFFANAASHIKPKGSSRKSKENKENEARRETNGTDTMNKKSASLTAEKGIKLVQEGQYAQAVSMFTEAIKCDPKDNRFFGNRSYCYFCLEQYPQALADAERSLQLAPDWPKGYFRKGSALMGMKRYSEAEKAMEQVLKLDKDCEEAVIDLFDCKVLQLMELGFDEGQSVLLLEKFSTVQAALASSDVARAVSQDSSIVQPGSPCPSLWVGNVTTELTEKHLRDLFKMYGEIESIRVLHERFCAFVNFKNANMAARAMEKLNGFCVENTRLVVRYPDRRTQKVLPTPLKTCLPVTQQAGAAAGPRRRGPVNGDECYFWRTTGCHFGDKCRYKHIPDQKGKDRKPWQP
ncbi:stress-induced-phosphoprotein 1 isoform X1 [Labrus bergylta]|uniref:stress-induced-phosphoprotein 1 isoform X1 n=1 Tax=Labrus bergylta TaxID=56723 RepID=UPI0009B3C39A|nr:hsp70-Hsp90 organizing protein-like isoform X1 [Labrus bergylta]